MKSPRLFMAALCAFPVSASSSAHAGEKPIAVQMYTLRSMASLEEQVKAVHAAGVAAVELVGTHGVSSESLNALLRQYSVTPISMHVSWDALRSGSDFEALIAFNKEIGNRLLVVPGVSNPTDADGWRALGRNLGAAAEQVAETGLVLAYHNHNFEFADFDGQTGLDLLFEAANPALKAEIDVAWAHRAGHDPAAVIRKFSDRIVAIQAKDSAKEGQSDNELDMADVGAGVLDWSAIFSACQQAGVRWYIIEHDLPPDPAVSIKASAAFLRANL